MITYNTCFGLIYSSFAVRGLVLMIYGSWCAAAVREAETKGGDNQQYDVIILLIIALKVSFQQIRIRQNEWLFHKKRLMIKAKLKRSEVSIIVFISANICCVLLTF